MPQTRRSYQKSVDFSRFAHEANNADVPEENEILVKPSTPKKANLARSEEGYITPKKNQIKRVKSPSSSSRKKPKIEPGSLNPPKDWEKIYSIVEELRSDRTAPLDSDGAEALPEKHLGDVVFRFQVLIALMLSSQTKDAVVGEAMRALQKHGLTVENIAATDVETLDKIIQKVGFHNNKSKYIKKTVDILIEKYNGDIPRTAQEMIDDLPGVGPKMAFIVESICYGSGTGIGVDTHMHRIFNDIKWVKSNSPEKTREQLEGWLPRDKWDEVNALWVGFGQESQQQKEKILRKALRSSRPKQALKLLQRVGIDLKKESMKFGLADEVQTILRQTKGIED
jgi:endonuclease-3